MGVTVLGLAFSFAAYAEMPKDVKLGSEERPTGQAGSLRGTATSSTWATSAGIAAGCTSA